MEAFSSYLHLPSVDSEETGWLLANHDCLCYIFTVLLFEQMQVFLMAIPHHCMIHELGIIKLLALLENGMLLFGVLLVLFHHSTSAPKQREEMLNAFSDSHYSSQYTRQEKSDHDQIICVWIWDNRLRHILKLWSSSLWSNAPECRNGKDWRPLLKVRTRQWDLNRQQWWMDIQQVRLTASPSPSITRNACNIVTFTVSGCSFRQMSSLWLISKTLNADVSH